VTVRPPPELVKALEADEAEELDKIIRSKRPDHLEALRQLVSDSTTTPEYRAKALYALGRWGDPSVASEIVRVLPTLGEKELIPALDALGRLGAHEAVEEVGTYAEHPSPQVRKLVVQALSRIGGSKAQTTLRAIAAQDSESWIRDLAAQRLRAP
jgi:HEAT repeat protein